MDLFEANPGVQFLWGGGRGAPRLVGSTVSVQILGSSYRKEQTCICLSLDNSALNRTGAVCPYKMRCLTNARVEYSDSSHIVGLRWNNAIDTVWGILIYIPANTGHSPNAVSMLGQHRRRCANIETALGECPVFAG